MKALIQIRTTEEMKAKIQKQADTLNMSVSHFIRTFEKRFSTINRIFCIFIQNIYLIIFIISNEINDCYKLF